MSLHNNCEGEDFSNYNFTRYFVSIFYLEVLDVQRSLFTAQLKTSETLQQELSSIVRLYKALGGGWVPEQDTTGYYDESKEFLNSNQEVK